MLPHVENSLQLGAFALENDFISSEQLSDALQLWVQDSRESLVQILMKRHVLTESDVQLLKALWEQRCSKLETRSTIAKETSEHRPESGSFRSHEFVDRATEGGSITSDCLDQSILSGSSFVIQKFVAAGGIGRVSVATDRALNRRIAIKEMLPRFADDPIARLRFAREAEITGGLEHPAIVPIHHYGYDAKGTPFYCMRWIDGENLREHVTRLKLHDSEESFRTIEFRRLLQSFITVCQAVAHAHTRGIIHRDIKPANILIGLHGETFLVDWGLAKRIGPDEFQDDAKSDLDRNSPTAQPAESNDSELSSESPGGSKQSADKAAETDVDHMLTTDGTMIGTPAFMSPEQANGLPAQARSDIFALGATFYFLLYGRAPYVGQSTKDVLQQARLCQHELSTNRPGNVPGALTAICQKAMQPKPQDRFGLATELSAEIERWLADEPVSVWPDPWHTRTRRWMRAHSSISAATAVLVVAVVVGSVAYSLFTKAANQRLLTANLNEQAARKLADEQSDLALNSLQLVSFDIQRQLQHVPAAQRVRAKLLETAIQGLNKVVVGLENRQQVAISLLKAHRDLGDLYLEVGDIGAIKGTESAKLQFQQAHQIGVKLVSQTPDDIEQRRQLAICLQKLGEAEAKSGSLTSAAEFLHEALRALTDLNELAPENEFVLRSLSISHNLLGDLDNQSGSTESAGSHYLAALKIREDQNDRGVQHPDRTREFIVSLNNVGGYYLRIGQSQSAAEYFQRSLKSSQQLVDENPEDFQALRDLSATYYKVGKLADSIGENQMALTHFRNALEIDERRLALDQSNSLAQRDCVESNLQFANAVRRLGGTEEAADKFSRAIALGEIMIVADPKDRRTMRTLAFAHGDLGDILLPTDSDEAITHYQRCLALMRQATQLNPTNPRGQSDIAFGLTKLGDGLMEIKQIDNAIDNYKQALQIHRDRSLANPTDVDVQRNLNAFQQRIGVALKRASRLTEARPFYEDALLGADQLTVRAPDNIHVQTGLLAILDSFGVFEHACQHSSAAAAHFHRALEIANQLRADGKLTGDDSTWPEYIAGHLAELKTQPDD